MSHPWKLNPRTHLGWVGPSLGLSFSKCKIKLRTPLWNYAHCLVFTTQIRRFKGGFFSYCSFFVFPYGLGVTYEWPFILDVCCPLDCPRRPWKLLLELITGEASSGYNLSWCRALSLVNWDRTRGSGLSSYQPLSTTSWCLLAKLQCVQLISHGACFCRFLHLLALLADGKDCLEQCWGPSFLFFLLTFPTQLASPRQKELRMWPMTCDCFSSEVILIIENTFFKLLSL